MMQWMKPYRKKLVNAVLALVCALGFGVGSGAQAATIDDVRELAGKPRLDVRAQQLKALETQRNEVGQQLGEVASTEVQTLAAFREAFVTGRSVLEVLGYRDQIEQVLEQKGQLLEQSSELEQQWVEKKDELTRRGVAVQKLSFKQIGIVGEGLPSPTWGTFLVTSLFGERPDPFSGDIRFHKGLDLGAPEGTPVVSLWSGVVTRTSSSASEGNLVEVTHDNGLVTRYMHLQSFGVVEGQQVEQGDWIATVGMTGETTGPHLHVEVVLDGESVNPLLFFGEVGNRVLAQYLQSRMASRFEKEKFLGLPQQDTGIEFSVDGEVHP